MAALQRLKAVVQESVISKEDEDRVAARAVADAALQMYQQKKQQEVRSWILQMQMDREAQASKELQGKMEALMAVSETLDRFDTDMLAKWMAEEAAEEQEEQSQIEQENQERERALMIKNDEFSREREKYVKYLQLDRLLVGSFEEDELEDCLKAEVKALRKVVAQETAALGPPEGREALEAKRLHTKSEKRRWMHAAELLRANEPIAEKAQARVAELEAKRDAPTVYFTSSDVKELAREQEKLQEARTRLGDLQTLEARIEDLQQEADDCGGRLRKRQKELEQKEGELEEAYTRKAERAQTRLNYLMKEAAEVDELFSRAAEAKRLSNAAKEASLTAKEALGTAKRDALKQIDLMRIERKHVEADFVVESAKIQAAQAACEAKQEELKAAIEVKEKEKAEVETHFAIIESDARMLKKEHASSKLEIPYADDTELHKFEAAVNQTQQKIFDTAKVMAKDKRKVDTMNKKNQRYPDFLEIYEASKLENEKALQENEVAGQELQALLDRRKQAKLDQLKTKENEVVEARYKLTRLTQELDSLQTSSAETARELAATIKECEEQMRTVQSKRLAAVQAQGEADAQMRKSKELEHKARKSMQLMDNKEREGRELYEQAEAAEIKHNKLIRRVAAAKLLGNFKTREQAKIEREQKAAADELASQRLLATQLAACIRIQSKFRGKLTRARLVAEAEERRRKIQAREQKEREAAEAAEIARKTGAAQAEERRQALLSRASMKHRSDRMAYLGETDELERLLLPIDENLQRSLVKTASEVDLLRRRALQSRGQARQIREEIKRKCDEEREQKWQDQLATMAPKRAQKREAGPIRVWTGSRRAVTPAANYGSAESGMLLSDYMGLTESLTPPVTAGAPERPGTSLSGLRPSTGFPRRKSIGEPLQAAEAAVRQELLETTSLQRHKINASLSCGWKPERTWDAYGSVSQRPSGTPLQRPKVSLEKLAVHPRSALPAGWDLIRRSKSSWQPSGHTPAAELDMYGNRIEHNRWNLNPIAGVRLGGD